MANVALLEIGSRVQINSFSDQSPQAQAASTLYTPKITALLRTANWDFARAQITLTLFKQATLNGVPTANPPPQPFLFSYLYPPDCLKARFVLPTVITSTSPPLTTGPAGTIFIPPAPTSIPFVIGSDRDPSGNPIKTIMTNLPNAQLIYTRDLSGVPDLWDALFMSGATAFLASYFINALARNAAQYTEQVAIAKSVIAEARVANGNEAIANVDHAPDWLRARSVGGYRFGGNSLGGPGGAWGVGGGWDQVAFPDGQFY